GPTVATQARYQPPSANPCPTASSGGSQVDARAATLIAKPAAHDSHVPTTCEAGMSRLIVGIAAHASTMSAPCHHPGRTDAVTRHWTINSSETAATAALRPRYAGPLDASRAPAGTLRRICT